MKKKGIGWLFGMLAVLLASCSAIPEIFDAFPSVGAPQAAHKDEDVYRLVPGDKISINVWRVPELTLETKVNRDGSIGFPLLGDVPAVGKTTKELEVYLREGLSKGFVENPVVTVTVKGQWRYFITGEVKQSGSFTLDEDINVYQAIIRAGGFTDFASKSIRIVRYEMGKRRVVRINVNRYLQAGEEMKEGRVQPGDVIVVPRSLF